MASEPKTRSVARTNGWYRAGVIFAWIFFASLALFAFLRVAGPEGVEGASPWGFAQVISTLGLIVSTVGTASTIILGWRADKRARVATKERIDELEAQVKALRSAQGTPEA